MKTIKANKYIVLSALLLSACAFAPAFSASSEWVDLYGGEARLSAVKDPSTNKITGVVEVKLKEGWKTYWRNPGDAGIPPNIDFAGSTFFSLNEVSFPVPEITKEDGAQFIGYHNTVRFLFSGQAEDTFTSLKLNFTAGVCEKICIPAMAAFEILPNQLNQSDPKTLRTLMLSKNYLPRKPDEQFSLNTVKVNEGEYSVVATIPKSLNDPKLLIEGPKGWFSGVLVPNKFSEQIAFSLPNDLPSNELHQNILAKKLRYTLIADGQAVEGNLIMDSKVK